MLRHMAMRGLLGGVFLGAALAAAPAAAHGQSISFGGPDGLGYGGPCLWGGAAVDAIEDHEGFSFYGLRPLDIANYQTCWPGQLQQNGYKNAGGNLADVVALGFGQAQVQRVNASHAFTLKSMVFGAGWSDAKVTVRGYEGMRDQSPTEMFSKSLTLSPGSLSTMHFGAWSSVGINFFLIDILEFPGDWGTSAYTHWETGAEMTDRTYFVSSMRVGGVPIPEPASVALLAIGLAGLGAVAGRRRGAVKG